MGRPEHDPSWLLSLFGQTRASLTLYACHWMSSGEAEDVVQQAFVKLYLLGEKPRNPRAWLYTAVRRAAISDARSRRRRRKHETGLARSGLPGGLFDQSPAALLNREAVAAALAALDDADREVVMLRVWGELTLSEIAGVTGLSTPTVLRRYQAALAKVRDRLEAACRTTKG